MGSQWGEPDSQRSSDKNPQLSTFLRFAVAPCGRPRIAEVNAVDNTVVRDLGPQDTCSHGCCEPWSR